MAGRLVNAAVFLGVALTAAVSAAQRTPTRVMVDNGSNLSALEDRLAQQPGDASTAEALLRAYVERNEPGMAVAVLQRSPGLSTSSPASADLAATALLAAGRGSEALAMTRQTISLCESQTCDASMMARSLRREGLLEAMLGMGIEDVDKDPEAASVAYRRLLRPVRVAMN